MYFANVLCFCLFLCDLIHGVVRLSLHPVRRFRHIARIAIFLPLRHIWAVLQRFPLSLSVSLAFLGLGGCCSSVDIRFLTSPTFVVFLFFIFIRRLPQCYFAGGSLHVFARYVLFAIWLL